MPERQRSNQYANLQLNVESISQTKKNQEKPRKTHFKNGKNTYKEANSGNPPHLKKKIKYNKTYFVQINFIRVNKIQNMNLENR